MKDAGPVALAVPEQTGAATRPAQVAAQASAVMATYVGLHVLLDLALWPTRLPRPPLLADPVQFFRALVIGAAPGFDFLVLTSLFVACWVGAFAVGRFRFNLSWRACFAVFVLAYLVLRQGYLFIPDLQVVADPTSVAAPIAHVAFYQQVIIKLFREALLPLAAIIMLLGAMPALQVRKASAAFPAARASMQRIGVSVRESWLHDTMHGLWIFFAVFLGAVAANWLANQVASTGDESAVFSLMTIDQVFLVSLAAGLGEEITYRVVVFGFLLWAFGAGRRTGTGRMVAVGSAVAIQAAFFGLVHAGYGNLAHVLTPAAFGVVAALVFLRFGFVPIVIVHILIDVVALGAPFADHQVWMAGLLGTLLVVSAAIPAVYFMFRLIDEVTRLAELATRALTGALETL